MKHKEDIYSKPKKLFSEYFIAGVVGSLAVGFIAIELYSFSFTTPSLNDSSLQAGACSHEQNNSTTVVVKDQTLAEPQQGLETQMLVIPKDENKTKIVVAVKVEEATVATATPQSSNPLTQILALKDEDKSWKLLESYPDYSLEDKQKLLHHAIDNNHAKNLIKMLERGFSFLTPYYSGDTHKLIFSRKYQVVTILIEHGLIDMSKRDIDGETLLHEAATKGHSVLIRLMVAKGIDINSQASSGATALHYPARYGYAISVGTLLKLGIDPNIKATLNQPGISWNDSTALHIAAKRGYLKIVKKLIEGGADRSIKDGRGLTALDIAKEGNKTEIITFLDPNVVIPKVILVEQNSSSEAIEREDLALPLNNETLTPDETEADLETTITTDSVQSSEDENSTSEISDSNDPENTL